jgi:anti-sigma factor RsiW
MTCRDLDALIDELASGELATTDAVRAHLIGCAHCTARLRLAQQMEQTLTVIAAPEIPRNFAAAVVRKLRRDWWRTEQHVDLWFNVALAGGLILVVAGVWLLLNASGLSAVARDASGLLAAGFDTLSDRIVASLPVYGAAAVILATTLAVWWWAEQESIL